MFTIVRPRSVGSFFISRSSERAKLRAVPSRRSTSSLVRSSRMTRMSAIGRLLFLAGDEQDSVDLVNLDELHLDALVARGRKVLADVVGPDRQLAVAAVCEAGELDSGGAAVVEERVDRRSDGASRVEDVVHEDAGAPLERELELAVAHDRLRVQRRLSPASDVDVAPVEGNVERPERKLDAGALGDQPAEPLRDRDTARVDPDERGSLDLGIALDDLVRDANERALDRLRVENDLRGRQAGRGQGAARVGSLRRARWIIRNSFSASLDRVKGLERRQKCSRWPGCTILAA